MRVILLAIGTVLLGAVLLFSPTISATPDTCGTCAEAGNRVFDTEYLKCINDLGDNCLTVAKTARCTYMIESCSPCEAAVIACDF